MKKALLKKELKVYYIDAISKFMNLLIDAEPECEEDGLYIIETMKKIAIQKSALGEIYDNVVKEHPDIEESFTRNEFVEWMRDMIQEGLFDDLNFDI